MRTLSVGLLVLVAAAAFGPPPIAFVVVTVLAAAALNLDSKRTNIVAIWAGLLHPRSTVRSAWPPSSLAISAILALMLASPCVVTGATRYEVKGGTETASIRNRASGFILGLMYKRGAGPHVGGTDQIDVTKTDGNWAYGRVRGTFGRWLGYPCGWVLLSRLHNTGKIKSAECHPDPQVLEDRDRLFSVVPSGHGEAYVFPAVIVRDDCYTYGNYDPKTGHFKNRYGTMPRGRGTICPGPAHGCATRGGFCVGTPCSTSPLVTAGGYERFGLRYLTEDGKAALIKDSGSPAGGRYNLPAMFFVKSECVMQLSDAVIRTVDPEEECTDGSPCECGMTCSASGACGSSSCDDGNSCTADSCDPSRASCAHSFQVSCTATALAPALSLILDLLDEPCGDGVLDPGEQCDDGNVANGDACSSNCTLATALDE